MKHECVCLVNSILPVTLDNSISPYEFMAKILSVVKELAGAVDDTTGAAQQVKEEIQQELLILDAALNQKITETKTRVDSVENRTSANEQKVEMLMNYPSAYIGGVVERYLKTLVAVTIDDEGNFVFAIPESLNDIYFRTAGYDADVSGADYGQLVIYSYT